MNRGVFTHPAPIGTTLQTGSRNGVTQLQGHISHNLTGTWNEMIDRAEAMGMDVSNLVME